jgi:hypothetical protein
VGAAATPAPQAPATTPVPGMIQVKRIQVKG